MQRITPDHSKSRSVHEITANHDKSRSNTAKDNNSLQIASDNNTEHGNLHLSILLSINKIHFITINYNTEKNTKWYSVLLF